MNHVYRLVWSKTRRMLVAVSEIAGSRTKGGTPRRRARNLPKLTPIAAALAVLGLAPGLSYALPSGGQVVAGQATISSSSGTMNVTQASSKAILDWKRFGVGANETVDFRQPSASSVALNRVVGTSASAIYGHLDANGQVFLVNPNGVYFAPGAEVDVGGLVASTLDISNADFLDGSDHFSGASSAGVTNAGTITAAKGGYVALIGHTVENAGAIATPGGTSALGAGSSVDMTLAGDSLLSFQVSGAAAHALAANGGLIQADGGAVILTAQAKDALLDTVVNNSGVIRAQTVEDQNGTIRLLGRSQGTVSVAGTLDASAPNGGNGGTIETSGAQVGVADGATITTKAASGVDGSWLIDPNDFTIAATGGDITGSALSTALGSGNVSIQTTINAASCTGATCTTGTSGNGDIFVDDTVTWSAHTLALSAYRDIVINRQMNSSGTAGLALKYGQGSTNGVIGGVTSSYTVNAPVNLASTGSFSTQLGTGGSPVNYTIISAAGSSNTAALNALQNINSDLNGHYVLGSDIDASATATWNLNGSGGYYGFAPIAKFNGNLTSNAFSGIFDGLGHTITGLTINKPNTTSYVGLFGYVGYTGNGAVRNVGLVGCSVSASFTAGNDGGVGGLVGYNDSGTISNVYVTGSVSASFGNGESYVGGLVGLNSGAISEAYATASVTGSDSATYPRISVGGLVGADHGGKISEAYATGSVSGSANASGVYFYYVGGLVGSNNPGSPVDQVYATGSVSGSGSGPGFASDVGGLAGRNSGTITNAYWDTTTTGRGTNAGLGSNSGTVTGGGGLSTAQLAAALPAGFSSSVWGDAGNQTTPYLLANASFGTVSGQVILGSDTSASPTHYGVILTLGQLQDINTTGLSGKYVLGTNIDASPTSGWNAGAGFVPLGNTLGSTTTKFSGIFDGLAHTISGLTINRPSSGWMGLFGYMVHGTVRNIGLVGDSVSGKNDVGGLVGATSLGTISNAYATGSVSGTNSVGGLAGDTSNSTVNHAYATGDVSGNNSVGGLIGAGVRGTISNAYATGNVRSRVGASHGFFFGGLVGQNDVNDTISNAYATGSVSGASDIGGLVGYNSNGTISNAYATGSVSGVSAVGGLVGGNSNGTISNVYATGSVGGTRFVGGLIGTNLGAISNAYWDTTTSGTSTGAGTNMTTGVTGLTAAQMLQQGSFTGFDFTTPVWVIYAGHTAPLLDAFLTPLTVTSTNQTQTYDGSTFTLINPTYSVTGAATSGHLDGLGDPYNGAVNVGTYSPELWSDQQGYRISYSGSTLIIDPRAVVLTGSRRYDGTALIDGALLSASNRVAGDSLAISGSGTLAGKGPGDEAIIDFSGLALSNANYTLTGASGEVTIVSTSPPPGSGLSPSGGMLNPESGPSPLLDPLLDGFGAGISGTTGAASLSTQAGGVDAPDATCKSQGGISLFVAPRSSGSTLCGGRGSLASGAHRAD